MTARDTTDSSSSSVIVIGAGPAGLTAALELCKRGYEVTVLEASNAIGGISQTIRHGKHRMDIGGHRFFSKSKRVMQWWFGIFPVQGALAKDDKALGRHARLEEGGPDPEKSDEVLLIRHRVSRIYFNSKFFDYPLSFKPRTFCDLGLVTTIQAGCSYLWSCVHKLPENNLENFYINRFGRKLYGMFFEGYTTKVWGRSPREISADWGAQRVKGLSLVSLVRNSVKSLLHLKQPHAETSLIEEFYYPKFGPGQLWEAVAKRVKEAGGEVLLNKRVSSLSCKDKAITSVTCADGSSYTADAVVSSMPLKELVSALGNVPTDIADIADGLPYRSFVTVGLLVERLAIQNMTDRPTLGNIIPDCWIYVQDMSVKLARIQVFNNWSPYLLPDPEHTVWLGLEYFCDEGDSLWSMDERGLVDLAAEELTRIGVLSKDTRILDSCHKKMSKAYPAYFDTYARIDDLVAHLNAYANLYCVGRNGQHRYNNMDHSMETAFLAVDAIGGGADKRLLWDVNTEKSYIEQKD